MTFVEALKQTKNSKSSAAALPEWPAGKAIWYERGSMYPDVLHRVDGSVQAMVLGEGIDADDLLRTDWIAVFR